MAEILLKDLPMGLARWVSNEQVFYFWDILLSPCHNYSCASPRAKFCP